MDKYISELGPYRMTGFRKHANSKTPKHEVSTTLAKKRFSEGLNDLFNDSLGATPLAKEPAMPTDAAADRKQVHKNFLQDLDSLLQEALQESMERYEANQGTPTPSVKPKSTPAASTGGFHGLDALIRQTIDVQEIESEEANGKKRLTVALDRGKLDKLKTIARLENSYLKDLLVHVIDGYINEYTKHKGVRL